MIAAILRRGLPGAGFDNIVKRGLGERVVLVIVAMNSDYYVFDTIVI